MVTLLSPSLKNASAEVCLPSPLEVRQKLSGEHLARQIQRHRAAIGQAIDSTSAAPFIIISGPCSLHCADAALDYGRRLANLQQQLGDQVLLVMRAYMEKPRTTVGWKGLINDPDLDGSHNLLKGIIDARSLLISLAELGLPLAVEALNPNLVPYYEDLTSWAAIGARTVESQTHREMASDQPFPVGLKNSTHGCLQSSVDAIQAASSQHLYTAVNLNGQLVAKVTRGNPHAHVILRGGKSGPNYSADHIQALQSLLQARGLNESCIVDCSHGNSEKQAAKQAEVVHSVIDQLNRGCTTLKGIMLESHLNSGNQSLNNDQDLKYGVSITDECLGWEDTQMIIEKIYHALTSINT